MGFNKCEKPQQEHHHLVVPRVVTQGGHNSGIVAPELNALDVPLTNPSDASKKNRHAQLAASVQSRHAIDHSHCSQCLRQTDPHPHRPEASEIIRSVGAGIQEYVESTCLSTGPGRYPTTVNLLARPHLAEPSTVGA